MIKAISNQTNQNTMHTTHVQAPTPAGRPTIFSRTRSLLRHTLVLGLMAFTAMQSAWATDYYFVYNSSNYLGVDDNGNITNKTTFDRSCIWTCVSNTSTLAATDLSTTSSFLYTEVNGTKYWLVGSTTNGNAVTVTTTAPGTARWRNSSNRLYYYDSNNYYLYYRSNSWRTSRSGNGNSSSYYSSNGWSSTDYRSTTTSISYTDAAESTVSTVTSLTQPSINPSSASLKNGGNASFSTSASATTVTTKRLAHKTFKIGNTTYYYHNSVLYTNVNQVPTREDTAPSNSTVTYAWSLSGDASSYLSYAPTSGTSTTVTHSSQSPSDLTATLTVTVSTTGASNKTATATIMACGPMVAPTIERNGNEVTLSTTNQNATIYYTTYGNDPTSSSTVYTGPFSIENLSYPVTVKAITIRNNDDSQKSTVSSQVFNSPKCATPVIRIASNGNVTITCATDGASIRYITSDAMPVDPTASTGTAGTSTTLNNLQYIKARAFKEGYNDSEVAFDQYVASGTSGGKVILNDYEDHSWSYYSDPDCPIRSLNPADVKITYHGNGTGTVQTNNSDTPSIWGANATTVKVGIDANDSTFIYYETLERTDGRTAASVDAAIGRCAYKTIANPFSVRPTYDSDNTSKYRGFYAWRVKSLSGGTIHSAATGGTSYGIGSTINAETEIYFAPSSEYGMEVEFEALWARAYVSTSGAPNNSLGVERNFYVITTSATSNITASSNPCTYTSIYPNGTTNGTTAANSVTVYKYGGFTASADSKIEYIILRNNSSTVNANGKNFTIGRGVSGYNGGLCATNLYGLNANTTTSFRFRIESGTFDNLYFMGQNRSFTNNAVMTTILGCDYDRARVKGGDDSYNRFLNVNADIALGAAIGTSSYNTSTITLGDNNNLGAEIFNCTVKSGDFDLGSDNYGGNYQFYLSAFGNYGNPLTYGKRTLIIEGGVFSDISGGMEQNTGTQNVLMLDLRIKGGTMNSPVYGAAQYSGAIGNRKFIVTGGEFKSWIAGGANGTKTDGGALEGNTYIYFGGRAVCNSNGSSTPMGSGNATGGNIFGAGSGNSNATETATVGQVYSSTIVIADNCIVERNVYGGGNYGYVAGAETTNKSDMYILGGTVNGNVFGGSNMQKGNIVNYTIKGGTVKGGVYGGSNARGNLSGSVTMNISGGTVEQGVFGGGYGTNSNSCDVAGTVDITMTGGTVLTGLYGGGNVNSTVSGVTTVSANGGTIGASNARANVHGGGLGSLTRIRNSVVVNIGAQNATSGATIYGDVYGGSAEGKTNGNTAQENNATTTVTLNAGTINGSLYGGGLGTQANAADVYGPVTVVVNGGSVTKPNDNPGSIFGCNNVNGSPKSTVTVTVNATDTTTIVEGVKHYAINGVYGGGNLAHYNPSTPGSYPTVTVNGCESSIKDVYGGGNAAAVPYTYVTINGGDIDRVFAGGNGESGTPAHVGYMNTAASPSANIYGTGTATAVINGGTINQVFGGSNSNGVIRGEMNVNVASSGSCTMNVNEVYGGGNQAASQVGKVTIGCMADGDTINYVYGGSNDADITGNVSLLIKGGHIKNVFGGNNTGHSISGSITVTVDWSQGSCTNNYLGNVFGGGNLATIGTAQSPKAPTVYIYDGTVSGNVYGGGKGVLVDGAQRGVQGKVTGNPTVVIGDNNNNHTAKVLGDVYGGGDAADVAGVPVVTVNDCNSEVGNVYGGGNAADINGATVTINGGTIGDVFGGGHGDKGATNPSKYADVKGDVTLNVYGGTIERVFAGSNSRGEITGTSSLTVNKSGSCEMKIGEVYGGGNEAAGKASTINIGCTGEWTTNHTNADTISNRIGYELEGIGYVYGGANQANIGTDENASNIEVTINSGIVANVFGGNNTSGTIYGTIAVNIEKTSETGTCGWYVGNVFGGGNLASYSGSPAVNIKNGLVSLNVYGGGKGSSAVVTGNPLVTIGDNTNGHSAYEATVGGNVYGGGDAAAVSGNTRILFQKGNNRAAKLYGGGNAAGVSGTATVDMQAGTVTDGIYGGCDSIGTVQGAIAVNITGGTIGANGTPANVHGGGYGAGTDTEGNVTVTINGSGVNIWGDVYGGSGFGNVNDAVEDSTYVHLQSGTIHGDIYGGGLGQKPGVNGAANNAPAYAALVNGKVNVTIDGGSVTGSVFGCNNVNGTPKGSVSVNINGTAATQIVNNDTIYALSAVYGGGNLAHYDPTNPTTSYPTVTVTGCNTSIQNVYGGGNAAAVPRTYIVINGGDIDCVFAGGNGESGTPANVGYKNADVTPTSGIYGAGTASALIKGGTINKIFGGSNSKGTIRESGSLEIAKPTSGENLCDMIIGEVYGGGNLAAGAASRISIGCTGTGNNEGITTVYGGANAANVSGNISLTIEEGKIANVYGGNNSSGTISGTITVNINQKAGACTWQIGNVFGGGKDAAYSAPQGTPNYPLVNIYNGTVANVYGGGEGEGAIVTANPIVTIGDITSGHESYIATITGNVYGGGKAAKVDGNTKIVYQKSNNSAANLFGGGQAADVTGSSTILMSAGTVTQTVYGGCFSSGDVGDIIMTLSGGTVGVSGTTTDVVFGGGYGHPTTTSGDISLTLSGTTVYGNLYGGSALGSVNAADKTTTITISSNTLHGTIFGGGMGSGTGDNTRATSNGDVVINYNTSNPSLTGLYGGANVNGVVKGGIEVNVKANVGASGTDNNRDIFGGGLGHSTDTEGDVTVNIGTADGTKAPVIYGDIYGGSSEGNVNKLATDLTTVNIYNGTIHGNVYGGGLGVATLNASGYIASVTTEAIVNGTVHVNIGHSTIGTSAPTIDGKVFGCNNLAGTPKGNVYVDVYQTAHTANDSYPDPVPATASAITVQTAYAISAVYGGGNLAHYTTNVANAATHVHIHNCDNTIEYVYGGGNAANSPATEVTIDGGRINYVFGGGNGKGTGNPGANIAGNATVLLNGGIMDYVFGGSNSKGVVQGESSVTFAATPTCTRLVKELYGGGNEATGGSVNMTIPCGTTGVDVVYGGSKKADMGTQTDFEAGRPVSIVLNIEGGNFDKVFGGNNEDGIIWGDVTLNLKGGTIVDAYGGNNAGGNIKGKITVNVIEDESLACDLTLTNVYGGGLNAVYTPANSAILSPEVKILHKSNGTSITGSVYGGGEGPTAIVTANPVVTIGDITSGHESYIATITGNVYGGGKAAKVDGNTKIVYQKSNNSAANLFGGGQAADVTGSSTILMSAGTVTQTVYGGCFSSGDVGDIIMTLSGGTVGVSGTTTDVVFGGGYGHPTTTSGDISLTLSGTTVYGNLYGGSALGSVNAADKTTTITISSNTLHGTIFGGGMGSGTGDNTRATSNGDVVINYNTSNPSLTGLYGGANVNGVVKGGIEVNVKANVGASGTDNNRDIFGGGLGHSTDTEGDVTVNIGTADGTKAPVIYGDIYGGSSEGNVNKLATDLTTVNIYNGTIHGNVYGGGLGVATLNASGYIASVTTEAIVNGTVHVNIGHSTIGTSAPTIDGKVFGCNNLAGTPKGNVYVDVYRTAGNYYPSPEPTTFEEITTQSNYAITAVYGGGNLAHYSTTLSGAATHVHIHNCNNTIHYVFGGGNAANTPATNVTIDGGRFEYVFGGGNGAGTGNPGANVQGNSQVILNGGIIDYVFGGSNTKGVVNGTASIDFGDPECTRLIKELYGGGNEAPGGSVDLTIPCGVTGLNLVYGGSRNADIGTQELFEAGTYRNVTLTIEGGSFDQVFGGNNQGGTIWGNVILNLKGGTIGDAFGGNNAGGNIKGTITVNVTDAESQTCPLVLTNVYGGGQDAAYTPANASVSSPLVNINHIKNGNSITGSVFGGGKGPEAIVTANPIVTIGDDNNAHYVNIRNNVYGGGDAAAVIGNTSVTLKNTHSTVANLFGGGNAAGVSGTASVTLTSGKVLTGVYGGCNSSGTVGGAITLNINGGQVGTSTTNAYGIFGGGKGSSTRTGDAVTVTIGTSPTTQTYPTIYGDVYGGSAEGQVNDALAEITKVWLQKGIINGDLYGGGFGDNNANALVNGSVQVVVDGGTVTGKVFGANNANGTPLGTVTVTINGTDQPQSGYALAEVYGGGNMADYTPTNITPATVIVNGCNNSIGVVYGGGNAADVLGTDVTIWGGTIGQVFGGGHGNKNAQPNPTEANVVKREGNGGNVAVKIYGGTIGEVFGGSNSKGRIEGASTVTIEEHIDGSHPTPCTFAVTDVYGGGNQADGNAGTLNIGCGANITGNIYGGAKQANVNNDIHLVITGGTLHNVFGGNNKSGNIKGSIIVDIEKDNACNTWHVDTVYGGGNLAAYSVHGYNNDGTVKTTGDALYNDPVVNIKNGTVTANVFGGGFGESATVVGNPHVNLIGGTVTGKVFGGGEAAPVTGSPVVSATYGQAASVYGGGLGSTAIVTGNPSVTINQASGQTLTVTDVFGGGDAAAVTGNTTVTLTAGSVSRAFGGGNLAAITGSTSVTVQGATVGNVYGGGNEAGVTQTSTVSMTSGAVTAGLYGGCNTRGAITGAVSVSVTGGTVGTDATHTANVHGGGYGNETSTGDNVTVLINGSGVNIWGDVYGGSGFGNVNSDAQDANNTTNVTLTAGTIHGSLYGGGLGQKPGVNGAANNAPSYAALVNGAVNVTVNGGKVTGGVFGANNANGTPKGAIAVVINGTDTPASGQYALNAVYGGGNLANCEPAATVTINGTSSIKDVFGGGNAASVPSTSVTVNGGNINRVFAGGNGETAPANVTDVNGGTVAIVHGGTIHQLFGGGNKQGTISGTMSVTVDKVGTGAERIDEVYGGGNEAPSGPGAVNILCGAENIGDVYGGANNATITGDIVLNIEGGQISRVFGGNNNGGNISGSITVNIDVPNTCNTFSLGNVYGGGNKASYTPTTVGSYPAVNIKSGAITGNVFGAGLGSLAVVHSNPTVSVTGGSIGGNVFGGGDEGAVDGNTVVTINGGTVHTKVFGGGNEAGVSGNANVTLTTGTVGTVADGGIYGGCNTSGNIGGYTLVNITGGTVGTSTYHANIHGGGYGQQTGVAGNVTVNIGAVTGSGNSAVYSGSAVITGDVYGGSALGNVNTIHTSNTGNAYNKTAVNLYGGTIDGNVYGGGLGDANTAALVYGDVDVFQYGAILIAGYTNGLPSSGMIFGCNNENGTPKGHVRVGVYKTTETTGQEFSSAANRATHVETDHTYAMAAVYGGGNHAAYVPDDLTNGTTEVFINGCGEVSIHSVYGGGNAASTPATDVKIMGAYEIEYVFGGGNGAGMIDGNPNPGANVGYYAYPASVSGPDQINDRTEYRYGSGVANTEIFGGRIHKVFGGSNTLGNVREATVAMLDESSDCKLELDGIYGGGKSAYMEGKAEIELGCIHGLEEIYGGAEQADVGSDIILTLTSGAYNKVYGGNNLGGRILGSITVNIEQTGCLPIEIGELYLGGNNAPYSVYGYNTDNSIIETGERQYDDPVVNLKSFKYIGTVFGGGEGSGATLAGNPTVNVNIATGWVDGQYKGTGEQDANHIYHASPQTLADGVVGQIFGGGNAAKVIGSTTINIGTQDTVHMVSLKAIKAKIEASNDGKVTMGGMQFELTQDGNSIVYKQQGDNTPVLLTMPIIQNVNGATISGNVYGGGNNADVTGSTHVIVGKEQQEVEPQQQGGSSPAPRRTEQEPAQNNNQQQPQQPQTNAATESQQTRSLNATRQ